MRTRFEICLNKTRQKSADTVSGITFKVILS